MGIKSRKLYSLSYDKLLTECILLQRKNYLLQRDIDRLNHEKQELEWQLAQHKECKDETT